MSSPQEKQDAILDAMRIANKKNMELNLELSRWREMAGTFANYLNHSLTCGTTDIRTKALLAQYEAMKKEMG